MIKVIDYTYSKYDDDDVDDIDVNFDDDICMPGARGIACGM